MQRSTLDKLISSVGAVLAVVLLAASIALFWTHNFIHEQVKTQLSAQKITFPAADSKSLAALPAKDSEAVGKYAGQQLVTGAQAKVFADNYIAVHLSEIAGGKTYAEVSSASMVNPTDQKLAGQVQVIFRGETLRGLLLNAYAFDTMATVANYAAYGALIASAVLAVLTVLGFSHAKSVAKPAKKRR